MPRLTKLEAIRIAMALERTCFEFYTHAQRYIHDPQTNAVLQKLIDDELAHCRHFKALHDEVMANDADSEPFNEETASVLSAMAADISQPSSVMRLALSGQPIDSISIIEESIRAEENSCRFYARVLPFAENESDRALLQDILNEEESHRAELEKMLANLRGE